MGNSPNKKKVSERLPEKVSGRLPERYQRDYLKKGIREIT